MISRNDIAIELTYSTNVKARKEDLDLPCLFPDRMTNKRSLFQITAYGRILDANLCLKLSITNISVNINRTRIVVLMQFFNET